MHQQTIQLEQLRQQIEDAEFESGSQSDYIDYGKPNEAQKKSAQEQIARMNAKASELKLELQTLIKTVRAQNPQAVEEWVKVHKDMLQKILTETPANSQGRVRQNTAGVTLKQWEQVVAGEREYVNINWHYLKDYKADVRKQFKKGWWPFGK